MELLLSCLVGVLILYGLGMILVVIILVPAVVLLYLVSHAIWVERTGGFKMIIPTYPKRPKGEPPADPKEAKTKQEKEDDDDIPEGFRGHYKYWRDPKNGKRTLMTIEEADYLQKEHEAEMEDEEWGEDWIEGREKKSQQWVEGLRDGLNQDKAKTKV